MIKVGIIGELNLCAEELLRILINHPDVELKWVCDRRAVGSRLDQMVPGIIGESDLIIEDLNEIDDVDLHVRQPLPGAYAVEEAEGA